VVVSTVRPNLNAVAQVPTELDGATGSTGFCVLRADASRLDGRYLFHWVRSPGFIAEMVSRTTGASYPAVSDRVVRGSKIPLPSLPEQRRIAAILDKADAVRCKRQQTLDLADQFLRSAFLDMFGDPVTNPKRWPVEELAQLIDPARPITYGILKPGPDTPDGIPYIRVLDMAGGEVAVGSVRRTTAKIAEQYKRSTLRERDVLLSIRGHVGRVALTPAALDGGNITQDTARLASGPPLLPEYLFGALSSAAIQHWMVKHVKGGAVQGINLGDVKRMPVPVPPMSDQERFAALWSRAIAAQSSARAALCWQAALSGGLVECAFRGRLLNAEDA
jgi:type I restriction enzyme S subunit